MIRTQSASFNMFKSLLSTYLCNNRQRRQRKFGLLSSWKDFGQYD